jgi:hypothetical protein
MTVRYNERTGVWDFDSVEEAKGFRDERAAGYGRNAAARAQAAGPSGSLDVQLATRVLPVLWALAEAGKGGMLGEAIAKVAGLKGPKGMAGLGSSVEKYLKAVTKRPNVGDLFWKVKKPGAPATWYVDVAKLTALGILEPEEIRRKQGA